MSQKKNIIKGTLILTSAGIISRIIGFYYRIFLAGLIGTQGLGLYQMAMPVASLSFALCASGIQTAISRYVSTSSTPKKHLLCGLFLSLTVSFLVSWILCDACDYIALEIMGDKRLSMLIKIIALSIPLSSVHACINGYYIGRQKSSMPALSQLLEQIIRVSGVYLIASIQLSQGHEITPAIGMCGLLMGEAFSALFCTTCFVLSNPSAPKQKQTTDFNYYGETKNILAMSFPLTANRVLLHIFVSIEAVLIPNMLIRHGLSSDNALSLYGIFTGMSIPLIMFPTAIVNAFSTMLLPAVSKAATSHSRHILSETTQKSIELCCVLGIFATAGFLIYGRDLCTFLFGNDTAGTYVVTLAWLCPFLYLAGTTSSILNGLSKTVTTCYQNVLCLIVRIAFVIFAIPVYGVAGYLMGVLVSQLLLALLHIHSLKKLISFTYDVTSCIIKPVTYVFTASGISLYCYTFIMNHFTINVFAAMIISGAVMIVLYILLLLCDSSTRSIFTGGKKKLPQ